MGRAVNYMRTKRKFKLSINDMQQIASERGGLCLSTEYFGPNIKLIWQCSKNHIWHAKPSSVKYNDAWCPYCFGNAKSTIEEMHKIALEKGGICLSTEYKNNTVKLEWKCSKNHVWTATSSLIKMGAWCPICSSTKLTIEEMHKIALEKGGMCLSTEYVNSYSKLIWQCYKGHVWRAKPNSIKTGTWCPICADTKLTIDKMNEIAISRNGRCLSTEYVNKDSKLIWQCSNNHIWNASPKSVKNGTWCPYCNIFYNQEHCRKYFESIFNEKFITCRPKWLKNPETNYPMQLDGYCSKFNLAFEYNGEQHYKVIKFNPGISNKQTNINFIKQQSRDKLKIRLCKKIM